MKKTYYIVLFIFFTLNIYGQVYVDAELFFHDGSSKKGIATINVFNDKIKFKKNKNAKKEKYRDKEIDRLVLKKDTISSVFKYKKILGYRAPKLLEVIKENNNLSLYAIIEERQLYGLVGALLKVPNNYNYIYYIVKNNSKKAIFFGETGMTSKKRLREIIKKNLKDCPDLVTKSENKEFKLKDIPKIVDYYNSHCNQ